MCQCPMTLTLAQQCGLCHAVGLRMRGQAVWGLVGDGGN